MLTFDFSNRQSKSTQFNMKLFLGSLLLATIASKVNGEGILWALFCEHEESVQWEAGSGVAPCYDIDAGDLDGDDPCELFDYKVHTNADVLDGDGGKCFMSLNSK